MLGVVPGRMAIDSCYCDIGLNVNYDYLLGHLFIYEEQCARVVINTFIEHHCSNITAA